MGVLLLCRLLKTGLRHPCFPFGVAVWNGKMYVKLNGEIQVNEFTKKNYTLQNEKSNGEIIDPAHCFVFFFLIKKIQTDKINLINTGVIHKYTLIYKQTFKQLQRQLKGKRVIITWIT